MKIIRIILLIFIITISSCNDDYKKEHYINKNLKLYELKCNDKKILTFEKCSCKSIPKNYFIPIVNDSDGFYVLYIKKNDYKTSIYTLYSTFKTYGSIKEDVNFITINDNVYFQDFIARNKDYRIIRGYIK